MKGEAFVAIRSLIFSCVVASLLAAGAALAVADGDEPVAPNDDGIYVVSPEGSDGAAVAAAEPISENDAEAMLELAAEDPSAETDVTDDLPSAAACDAQEDELTPLCAASAVAEQTGAE